MDNRPDQTFLEEADRELSRLSDTIAALGVVACLVAGISLTYVQTSDSGAATGCTACDMPSCERPSRERDVVSHARHRGGDECSCSDCPSDCTSDV